MTTQIDQHGNKIERFLLDREAFNRLVQERGLSSQDYDTHYSAMYSNNNEAIAYTEGDITHLKGSQKSINSARKCHVTSHKEFA
jgi:hypothetical protein